MAMERKSLADQVESALLSEIERGRWTGLLPGLRELAAQLEVSVPTLSVAIARLTSRGVLLARGGRRRFQVAPRREKPAKTGRRLRRLLIITGPGGIAVQNKVATDVIHAFSIALSRRGWTVKHAEVDFYDARRPRRNWDEMLKGDRIDRILVLFGREAIGQWAIGTGIPTCFLGGNAGDLPIPLIAVRSDQMVEHALERLIAAGHSRFLVPLCRRHPRLVDLTREAYTRALGRHGLTPRPEIEVPAPETHTPETLIRQMERAWSQPRPPTGLVFMDWRDCISGLAFLMSRGLRIPDDVSVVVLTHEFQVDWFRPQLAHFRYPQEGFVKALLRWVDDKGYNRDVLLRRMIETFEPGESVGPPGG